MKERTEDDPGLLGGRHDRADGDQHGREQGESAQQEQGTRQQGPGFEDQGAQFDIRQCQPVPEEDVADHDRGQEHSDLDEPDKEQRDDFPTIRVVGIRVVRIISVTRFSFSFRGLLSIWLESRMRLT